MIIPSIWKNKKCSKPPSSFGLPIQLTQQISLYQLSITISWYFHQRVTTPPYYFPHQGRLVLFADLPETVHFRIGRHTFKQHLCCTVEHWPIGDIGMSWIQGKLSFAQFPIWGFGKNAIPLKSHGKWLGRALLLVFYHIGRKSSS